MTGSAIIYVWIVPIFPAYAINTKLTRPTTKISKSNHYARMRRMLSGIPTKWRRPCPYACMHAHAWDFKLQERFLGASQIVLRHPPRRLAPSGKRVLPTPTVDPYSLL